HWTRFSAPPSPPQSTPPFPYTTLFRSEIGPFTDQRLGIRRGLSKDGRAAEDKEPGEHDAKSDHVVLPAGEYRCARSLASTFVLRDRKSTRLNSSHLGISYAVFCLKKHN